MVNRMIKLVKNMPEVLLHRQPLRPMVRGLFSRGKIITCDILTVAEISKFSYFKDELEQEYEHAAAPGAPRPGIEQFYVVARVRKKILGSTVICQYFDRTRELYPDWWIWGLYVEPRWRGFGIGELVTRRAIDKVKAAGSRYIHLVVDEDNAKAVALYRKAGFAPGRLLKLQRQLRAAERSGRKTQLLMTKELA